MMSEELRVKSEKYKFGEFDGITLIALVITIIILIILAGVAINLSLGENGIFRRAKQAGEDYKEAGAREKLELMLADYLIEKETGTTLLEYLNKQKEQGRINDFTDNGNGSYTIIVDGYMININEEELKITEITEQTPFKKLTNGKAKFIYNKDAEYVENVEVSIEIDEAVKEHKVQYKIGEGENATWVDYEEGTTFKVNNNIHIYGRIVNAETNEIGYSFVSQISNIDKIPPQKATIVLSATSTSTDGTINATVTQYDNETDIDITNCKYIINTSQDEIGKDSDLWNSATKFSSNPQEVGIKQTQGGNYYLHVLSLDTAENRVETVSEMFTFKAKVYYLNAGNSYQGFNFPSSWQLKGGRLEGSTYKMDAGATLFATYKTLVDFTNLETLHFHNYGCYTASDTIVHTLGLVDQIGGPSYICKIQKSQYSSGNNRQTINLSLDVSEVTR